MLNQPVVNAFAAPGGVIALYSGLILAADDENEVAGVLAHEIAHITQLHLYRAYENQKAMTIPIALAMLALVLVDHYLRHRAQNQHVVSPTPHVPAQRDDG